MLPSPRSRRSRGSIHMQAANPPEVPVSPPLVAPAGNEHSPAPEEGLRLSVAANKVEPSNNETDNPGISTQPLENKAAAQANPSLPKKPADERHASDTGAVGEMKTKFTASKSSPLWDKYIKIAEEEDKDIFEDWEGFVLESSKNLQPNPADATVLAIRELTNVVHAGFQTSRDLSPSFTSLGNSCRPSMTTVVVNCLWFFSLGLSISVSLFAMLAKRWCYKSRSTHSGTSYERAVRRQKAWDTLQKWKLELLIEQLPTVMHVALMTFFIGLMLYLSEIHPATMIVTAIPIGVTILAYGVLTVLPAWSPAFPMVTPFTRILQAGSWYITEFYHWAWPNLLRLRDLHIEEWIRAIRSTSGLVTTHLLSVFHPAKPQGQNNTTVTGSPLASGQWALSGCSKPVGQTAPYPPPDGQRHAFQAVMWLLRNSNDKTLINEILEYIGNFPEVVLDSFASSQELHDATVVVAGHFQRLKHDAVEWHDLNATQFREKCGKFMYLNARPWLYSTSSADRTQKQAVDEFRWIHDSFMSPKETQDQIKNIEKQPFTTTTCIPWLHRQAIKAMLDCPPEGGFQLCRGLYKWVSCTKAKNPEQEFEEIYSTFSWMLLNLTIDTANSYGTFWPRTSEDGTDSAPEAKSDSALTLSYFRHSEKRRENSSWLKVVGLSGILNIPTYYWCDDVEPDLESNHEYYAGLIELLRATLSSDPPLQTVEEGDPYVGSLPVYIESDIRLYEFDSLQYCFDALDRASQSGRFAQLHDQLQGLKDLIPETRRNRTAPSCSKSEVDLTGSPTPVLPQVHSAEDDMGAGYDMQCGLVVLFVAESRLG
ncbi:hypothetical protein RSAG8_11203, partial [Rhizoctonia solani AG-8 WAC10335]